MLERSAAEVEPLFTITADEEARREGEARDLLRGSRRPRTSRGSTRRVWIHARDRPRLSEQGPPPADRRCPRWRIRIIRPQASSVTSFRRKRTPWGDGTDPRWLGSPATSLLSGHGARQVELVPAIDVVRFEFETGELRRRRARRRTPAPPREISPRAAREPRLPPERSLSDPPAAVRHLIESMGRPVTERL